METTRPGQIVGQSPSDAAAELAARLARFDGGPSELLALLLQFECLTAPADAGAILRPGSEGEAEVLAIHPPPAPDQGAPTWLGAAVEAAPAAFESGRTLSRPAPHPTDLYGQPASRRIVIVPLVGAQDGARGAAAFLVQPRDRADLEARQARLQDVGLLLSAYEAQRVLGHRQGDFARLQAAMEVLAAVNRHRRFAGAAMAMCNEIASRFGAERVALGFLRGRYVRLRAMSHTEKFDRKTALVQQTESVMEECLDQDIEVVHPAAPAASYVSREAAQFAAKRGGLAIVGLPVRHEGEPVAVVLVERPADRPFEPGEVEALRLATDLSAARIVELERRDRWVGARTAAAARRGLAHVLGPKHTWLKLIAIALLGAILFLVFAKGEYKVEAPFTLEASTRQIVSAPFDGTLEEVFVEPGDSVVAGETELGRLKTAPLRIQLASLKAEQIGHLKEARAASDRGRTAEAQIAEAQADKVAADIRLLEYRIAQADLVAPLSGKIVSEDLKPLKNRTVQTGDPLFEIDPIESLRAVLHVPQDRIDDVAVGDEGELALVGDPGRRIGFTVDKIHPVAEVVNQKNVFRVRVRLHEKHEGMFPGMEGVAKVHAGERRYAWIWTHRLVDWVRMKLWVWGLS